MLIMIWIWDTIMHRVNYYWDISDRIWLFEIRDYLNYVHNHTLVLLVSGSLRETDDTLYMVWVLSFLSYRLAGLYTFGYFEIWPDRKPNPALWALMICSPAAVPMGPIIYVHIKCEYVKLSVITWYTCIITLWYCQYRVVSERPTIHDNFYIHMVWVLSFPSYRLARLLVY